MDNDKKPSLNYDGKSRWLIPYNDGRTPPEMKYIPEEPNKISHLDEGYTPPNQAEIDFWYGKQDTETP